jgi:hypothetical protein
MMDNKPQPRYWTLYPVLPATAGLFVLEVQTTASPLWHTVAELGIVLFAFAYVGIWMGANTLTLLQRGQVEQFNAQRQSSPRRSASIERTYPEPATTGRALPPGFKPLASRLTFRLLRTVRSWIL